jgi:hypothetical protein
MHTSFGKCDKRDKMSVIRQTKNVGFILGLKIRKHILTIQELCTLFIYSMIMYLFWFLF